jgi:anti-sigma B factor antagonist
MVIGIPLKIAKKEIRPGVVVLELSGRIHMGPDCQRIEQEVEQLLGRSEKRLIFDLSKVSNVDSSGVAQIVKCFSKLKNSGGSLCLAGVTGMLVSSRSPTWTRSLKYIPPHSRRQGIFCPRLKVGVRAGSQV